MKIVLDVFGCDNKPDVIVKGAIDALKADSSVELILSGNADIIRPLLGEFSGSDRIELLDAREVITNDDQPATAIRAKKDSSLVRAVAVLKERDDVVGLVSAGSTGAVLSAATLQLGRMKGVLRPALCSVFPTIKGGNVCLVDCGANVDCKSDYLVQFALMGISLMRSAYGVENPRVAILSVGTEDKKGNELTKETFAKLKDLPINFAGNMEARDALSGDYDVLVCDGFTGNVYLKSVEGSIKFILSKLKTSIKSYKTAKFGYLFMGKAFRKLKKELDYNSIGGAPLLGVQKIVIKSHGSSDDVAICASILQASRMAQGGLIEGIRNQIESMAQDAT